MCQIITGKAYVRGYDVYLNGTTVIDVDKPRDVKDISSASIPFSMGSLLRVNNVQEHHILIWVEMIQMLLNFIIKEEVVQQLQHWTKGRRSKSIFIWSFRFCI